MKKYTVEEISLLMDNVIKTKGQDFDSLIDILYRKSNYYECLYLKHSILVNEKIFVFFKKKHRNVILKWCKQALAPHNVHDYYHVFHSDVLEHKDKMEVLEKIFNKNIKNLSTICTVPILVDFIMDKLSKENNLTEFNRYLTYLTSSFDTSEFDIKTIYKIYQKLFIDLQDPYDIINFEILEKLKYYGVRLSKKDIELRKKIPGKLMGKNLRYNFRTRTHENVYNLTKLYGLDLSIFVESFISGMLGDDIELSDKLKDEINALEIAYNLSGQ